MTSLTVMTFNIRYDEEADGRHAWRYRRDLVRDEIAAHDPDLLGVQEPMPHQWDDLTAALPALSRLRSAGDESDDDEPVGGFFRTSRLEWRDGGTFWLSATPAVPHSTSWPHDHGNYRIDWILLRGPIACTSAEIDTRRPGGLPPSDHYPVIATIEWE